MARKLEDYPSQPLSCFMNDESLHADAGTLVEIIALVIELVEDLNVLILTVLLRVQPIIAVEASLPRKD